MGTRAPGLTLSPAIQPPQRALSVQRTKTQRRSWKVTSSRRCRRPRLRTEATASRPTRTRPRSRPRAGTRLTRTRPARRPGRQSTPRRWTRPGRRRRRSPWCRGMASTSWGCTPKRDRRPPHRPPRPRPATPTCSAPSWGPLRLLRRPPQATSSGARTPCSSQARPLPQARGARLATAPAPRLPVRALVTVVTAMWGSPRGSPRASASWEGLVRGRWRWPLVPRGRGRACPHGGVWALCAQRWLRRHHRARQRLISSCSSGVATADPFDALLLTSDLDAPAQPQPDPFCEFLNADPAAPPAPFPSAHSAPPPACSTDFLQLGEWPAPRPWAHPAWLPVLPPGKVWAGVHPKPSALFGGRGRQVVGVPVCSHGRVCRQPAVGSGGGPVQMSNVQRRPGSVSTWTWREPAEPLAQHGPHGLGGPPGPEHSLARPSGQHCLGPAAAVRGLGGARG